jgi:hypothetical protein
MKKPKGKTFPSREIITIVDVLTEQSDGCIQFFTGIKRASDKKVLVILGKGHMDSLSEAGWLTERQLKTFHAKVVKEYHLPDEWHENEDYPNA